MENTGEIIGKPMEIIGNVLAKLTKQQAASGWCVFKRFLSTASEPLLRKNMGERYLSGEAINGGMIVWVLATVVALMPRRVRP